MKALIYKGLDSKHGEEIILKQGLLIPQLKHLGEFIAVSGGVKCSDSYEVKDGDIILVRVFPRANTNISILADPVKHTISDVLQPIVKLTKPITDFFRTVHSAFNPPKPSQYKSLNRSIESLPYLAGAENQQATGQTQPYIIGKHLFTPFFLDYPINKIAGTDGRDQYSFRVFELGFNQQVIKEVKAGAASLRKFSDTTPQAGKFYFDADSSLYDETSFIEISQGGEFQTPEFNKRFYHAESGASVPKKKDGIQGEVNFEFPRNSKYLEVAILFNGLIGYNNEGSKTSRTVEVIPQYSLNGSTWTSFTFTGSNNNVFTRMTQEQIRFTARKTFTYNEIKNQTDVIKVRLLCPTVKSEAQGYDDCYCVYTQAELFDEVESKKANTFVDEKRIPDKQRLLSTRIGIMVKATETNQDKLSKINVITQGVAPTPNNWNAKIQTSNPASWLVEVLTSETHSLSAIAIDELDLPSFEDLYNYCETENIRVNLVLIDSKPKHQVVETILSICDSVLFRNLQGKIQVATDKVNNQPVALFTSQNIINTTVEKTYERKADGVLINYIDESLGYENASYLVMRDGMEETPQSVIATINCDGITTYEQIVKHGRKMLAIEKLRPKLVRVSVSLEGVFYSPLSKVLLQTESLKTGVGNGEIKNIIVNDDYITHLELYDTFSYTSGKSNIAIISLNRFGESFSHQAITVNIKSAIGKIIELTTPIQVGAVNAPMAGDLFAYGVADAPVTSEMIIIGSEENANGYVLTLADYNTAIYETVEIPEYKPSWASNLGDKPPATLPPLTLDDLQTYVELEAPDTPTITATA
ncbi:MAG TPA: hypothetical protein PLR81_06735, partial [Treponemataceae bacterium]|nr:hypothetical protein [Treponemataceae bacterium]